MLSLWLVLFLFFSILLVEVFSLTKWNSGETRNQNYSTMPKALVMLAFMTTGYARSQIHSRVVSEYCHREGWNQYMHDL